jgi:hypothetical protein
MLEHIAHCRSRRRRLSRAKDGMANAPAGKTAAEAPNELVPIKLRVDRKGKYAIAMARAAFIAGSSRSPFPISSPSPTNAAVSKALCAGGNASKNHRL